MKRRSPPSARSIRRWLIAGAVLLALLPSARASAHALFERATPGPGTVLSSAPTLVHIWFSEDLSSSSTIVVWDRFRHPEQTGSARVLSGQSRQLEVGLKPLAAGSYLVLWTSVSSDDGHILRGSYVFSVQHTGPLPSLAGVSLGSGGQSFPDGPTLIQLIAHWLELLGAVVWVGAVAFGVFVLPMVVSRLDPATLHREHRRRAALTALSLMILVLSSSVLLLMEADALADNDWRGVFNGAIWSALLDSDYGRLWLSRQALAFLALADLLLLKRARATDDGGGANRMSSSLLIIGLLYLYLFAASGHAASAAIGTVRGGHVLSISIAADWLHFIADALWFGGQIYLVLALIPSLRLRESLSPLATFLEALNRFSPVAYLSIALYAFSGLFAAKVHIPSWYAFFNSIYGRTLIVKMVLIGLMMLVSALTVYVLRPAIRRSIAGRGSGVDVRLAPRVEGLLWWLRVNPVLGVGVLLATSVMFYYPVPYGFAPPPSTTYSVSAQGVTGTVSVKPAKAGLNQVTITLRDPSGKPVPRAGVRVLTTMLDMVMGTGIGVLLPTRQPGTFAGSTELGMGGRWRLLFLVYFPNGNFVRLPLLVRVGI